MAQIFKIRTPDGDVVTPGDWTGAEPLWSTIEISEGNFQKQVAFSYGIGAPSVPGSVGPRKATDADTNLEGEDCSGSKRASRCSRKQFARYMDH